MIINILYHQQVNFRRKLHYFLRLEVDGLVTYFRIPYPINDLSGSVRELLDFSEKKMQYKKHNW